MRSRRSATAPQSNPRAVLSIAILDDGGVTIDGTVEELNMLAEWLHRAVAEGSATPAFVSDERLTAIYITRSE